MLNVILKLLATNSANYMICTWLWLLNTVWMLFFFLLLLLHTNNIVFILLIQKLSILLSKFSFFLKLENGCSIWGFQIKCWDVIFTDINLLAKDLLHLLLLLRSVLRKIMAFMSVGLLAGGSTTA